MGDCVVTTREISKLSSAVLLNCVDLRLHCGTPCRVSLGLRERLRLIVVARKMQLRLQIVRDQSRHWLVAEKVLHCTISSKELCRLAKKRSIIRSGRLRVPKGITHERHQEVQDQGKVGTKICRSFPNSISQGRSGLLTEATTITIRCA
jgi:hypothetical protein